MTGREHGETGETGDDDVGRRIPWVLLSLAAPPPGEAFLMVDALWQLGARSVEREGRRVVAAFPSPADPESLAAEARLAVRASTSLAEPAVTWSWLGRDAWAARFGSDPTPTRVTDRIVVVAETAAASRTTHDDDDLVLRLEPSAAFGNAEHPTTRSCLRLLDGLVDEGDRVLDVGAGSGILSIAAALLGARRATALEADPLACAAARRNVTLNRLGGRVRVRETRVTPGSLGRRGRYHGVVANLQTDILRPLLPDLAAATAPGGWVVLSGILPAERDGIVRSAEAAGLELRSERVDQGWWTARLSR